MPTRSLGDAIRGDLNGNALDFIAHLRAYEIQPGKGETYWDVQHNGKSVCFIWIDGAAQAPGPWTIWSDHKPGSWAFWPDEDGRWPTAPVDECVKKIAWAHMNRCASCGGDCSPSQCKTVLGKAFDGLCSSALAFTNPDAEAVACAKRMIDARMADMPKASGGKPHFAFDGKP